MKKVLLGFLLILAIFTLTACDSDDDSDGLTRKSYQETISNLV